MKAFKFPQHYDAHPSMEKDVYTQRGPKILKSVMRTPLSQEMHHGGLLKAYFYTARNIVQGSASPGPSPMPTTWTSSRWWCRCTA